MNTFTAGDALRLMLAFGVVGLAWLWDDGRLILWWRHGVAVWRTRRRRRRAAK